MELPSDEYAKYRMRLIAAYAIACIGFLIAIFALDLPTEVMRDRYWKNAEPIFNGEPFSLEYPPFSLVFILIPRLFGWTAEAYEVFYVIEVFVFMVIGLIYTDKLAEHFGKDRKNAMLAYSVLTVLLLEFVTDRYDIFPAVIVMMAIYYFVKEKYPLAFALVAIGMLTKLYPAMLFPIFFLIFAARKEWNEALKGTLVFGVTTLAVVLPIMIVDPDLILDFLSYHSDRPLQIETLAASLIYPFAMLGLITVKITSAMGPDGDLDPENFGSDNLVGTVPDAVAGVLSPIMVAGVLAICFFFLYVYMKCEEKERMRLLGLAIAGVIMTFILLGKVFSSQYLIWAISPIVLILLFEEDMFRTPLFRFTVATFIMTQVEFVYNIGILGGGSNINDFGMIIILVRNILAVIMLYLIVRGMYDILKGSPLESDVV